MSVQSKNYLPIFCVTVTTTWSDTFGLSYSRTLDVQLPFGEFSVPLDLPKRKTPRTIWAWFRWQSSARWYRPMLDDNEGLRDQYKRERKAKR